jgi:hypothetical protein
MPTWPENYKTMNSNEQNDEYSLFAVQEWEINCGEELTEDSCLANTLPDQQADQSCEHSS